MEYALLNGIRISASEISEDYETETKIRRASAHKQLVCVDDGCKNPTLKYCHGDKNEPYFAHIINSNCDYARFDREDTPEVKTIRAQLFELLKKKGYQIEREVKLIKHYIHILCNSENNSKFAIEFASKFMTASRNDEITKEYETTNFPVKWVVVNNDDTLTAESEAGFIKRHSLNKNPNKDLLIINLDATKVTEIKFDNNTYIFDGVHVILPDNSTVFRMQGSLNDLVIENGDLVLNGFNARFNSWIEEKHQLFQKAIEEIKIKRAKEKALLEKLQAEREKARIERERARIELEKRKIEEEKLKAEKAKNTVFFDQKPASPLFSQKTNISLSDNLINRRVKYLSSNNQPMFGMVYEQYQLSNGRTIIGIMFDDGKKEHKDFEILVKNNMIFYV